MSLSFKFSDDQYSTNTTRFMSVKCTKKNKTVENNKSSGKRLNMHS